MPGWGGTEVHLLRLSRALRALGHRVTVGCRRDSWLWRHAREAELPVVEMCVRRQYDLAAVRPLRAAMRRGRFEVVHTHSYRDYLIPALAARAAGIRCVVGTRHLYFPFRSRLRARICTPGLYHRLIAVSAFVAKSLTGSGVDPQRVTVIPNGIEIGTFAAARGRREAVREELGLAPEARVVGAVGRLTAGKGYEHLVEAVASLPDELEVTCLFVGEGEERSRLEAQVADLRAGKRIRFLGYREDVPAVLAALDVLALPSMLPEADSLAALEALASGTPVVAYDQGAVREVVVDSVSGVLLPPGEVRELAAALAQVLSRPDRGAALGEAGRASVQGRTVEAMAVAVSGLYQQVLGDT